MAADFMRMTREAVTTVASDAVCEGEGLRVGEALAVGRDLKELGVVCHLHGVLRAGVGLESDDRAGDALDGAGGVQGRLRVQREGGGEKQDRGEETARRESG
jgi:hypothetical protein